MKQLITAIVGCLCLAARAEMVAIPVTLTANGTTAVTAAITDAAVSETNWVSLSGIIVTLPAGASGTISLANHIGGVRSAFDTITLNNASDAAVVKTVMTGKSIASSRNEGVAALPIFGTNGLVTVTQDVATTNAWALQLLITR